MEDTERKNSTGVELSKYAKSIYEQGEVAKFLATASVEQIPNVALIVSQIPIEENRIAFGEFMMVKTKKNIQENPRFASLAITPKLEMAGFKGTVNEWIQAGPVVDKINSIDFFRYNAYMGIRSVALASIDKPLEFPPKMTYPKILSDFLVARTLGRIKGENGLVGIEVPPVVRGKFNSIMSIKVLSFMDNDGYPGIAPIFGIFFSNSTELRFKISTYNENLKSLDTPCQVALNVLTLDLMTYQVKGKLLGFEKVAGVVTGIVRTQEAYSCIPPFCGRRVA